MRDRSAIMDFIAQDNVSAAIALDEDFARSALRLRDYPRLGHPGVVTGTRDLIVRRNYRLVYRIEGKMLVILAVVHAKQMWGA